MLLIGKEVQEKGQVPLLPHSVKREELTHLWYQVSQMTSKWWLSLPTNQLINFKRGPWVYVLSGSNYRGGVEPHAVTNQHLSRMQ